MSLLLYTALLLPPAVAFAVSFLFNRYYLSAKKKREILSRSAKVFLKDNVLLAAIKKNITSESSFSTLAGLAEEQVDDFLRIRLVKELPYIGMLIGEKTIDSLKKIFMKELEVLFPTVMNQYLESLHTANGSKPFAEKYIDGISNQSINEIFKPVTRMIITGAVLLGVIIGLLQSVLFLLLNN